MAESLEPERLHYACSAHYLDHIDGINLTEEQQTFLKEITDPLFRESIRDFMVNQQFRRDYWVKGARSSSDNAFLASSVTGGGITVGRCCRCCGRWR